MSRIDISVDNKITGEPIINRGFCRDIHISYFCVDSEDAVVREFASDLSLGVDITEDNIVEFMETIEYVVSYLTSIEKDNRKYIFSFYKEDVFDKFVSDLNEGLQFLQTLRKDPNLPDYNIQII